MAVIRISGPLAFQAAADLCGTVPEPRRASLRLLRDPASREALDEALVLAFPGPGSFTGEDSVELQLHGSLAVVRRTLDVLGRVAGLRPAEAGEFTRQAFANGRLTLAEVEALGDLLTAETAAQHRQAMAALGGRIGRLADGWKASLVRALAYVEASIDFVDEELPGDVLDRLDGALEEVALAMAAELAGARMAERVREGFVVALVGPPNVGKSTLLNLLAGREAALTAATAGTTRDVIEVRMDLDGLALTVLDMAGLRDAAGAVEALGIARARERAGDADLRIFLLDTADELGGLGVTRRDGDVVRLAKADLVAGPDRISGRTGAGVDAMLAEVAGVLGERQAVASSLSHVRQREAVAKARAAVEAARAELRRGGALELVAEDLRSAVRSLDFLAGRVDVEAVLDVVFAAFCLGK